MDFHHFTIMFLFIRCWGEGWLKLVSDVPSFSNVTVHGMIMPGLQWQCITRIFETTWTVKQEKIQVRWNLLWLVLIKIWNCMVVFLYEWLNYLTNRKILHAFEFILTNRCNFLWPCSDNLAISNVNRQGW